MFKYFLFFIFYFNTPSYALDAISDTQVLQEVTYIFNTFLLLFCGVLVMFMAAGFAMLEAGMVRSKSVAVILTKNITLYSIAGIMFYLLGYNLMYDDVGSSGVIGKFAIWDDYTVNPEDNYSKTADWFFQMVFVATCASIVSGTLAERIKIWPFFLFTIILTGFIYPIAGAWKWGGGWLDELGFIDFAGSTMVHSLGGWAALAGAILLGARRGRFNKDGKARFFPGASMPQVTLGTFILWMGWFGFNGGSQLAFGSTTDASAVANIFANTNAAAAGGVIAVMLVSQLLYKRLDLPLILNGALAGLVSITAEPVEPNIGQAILIGAAGGIFMMLASKLLEKFKIDDVVGAIPVHLVAGIWGTIAVILTNEKANLTSQLIGILSIGVFCFTFSMIIWLILKYTIGIRLHWSVEDKGADISEIGLRAYNLDFGTDEHGKPSNKD
ncbi:MAG: ammonium transporter [Pseudomonadota bacterium]